MPQFISVLETAPPASMLPTIKAQTLKAWVNYETEADALSDAESSDDDTSDSSSEDESDGEYEFIKKNGPKAAECIHFSNLHRKKVTSENPGLKNTEITKKLAELWKVALQRKGGTDEKVAR